MTIDLNDLSAAILKNEADVEQKLIFPLMNASEWLAIPNNAIFPKQYLPPLTIDKGSGRRSGYYPDYSVWIDGLPVLIVEAKSPLEGVINGYREAQLYAHEVNKAYPSGVAPISFVVCTDGQRLRVGHWDSNDFKDYRVADLKIGTGVRSELIEMIGAVQLYEHARLIGRRFRPTQWFRPIDSAGGDAAANRRISLNSFATEIAPLIRMFFVSESAERIDDIIQKAYVSSEETTKYDAILEGFLRDNIQQVQTPTSKEISTSAHHERMLTPELRRFRDTLPSTGQMQLIIGSVGSGKSLFCQRYKRFLQPDDVAGATYWSFIDFNKAPEDLTRLEDFLCLAFIEGVQQQRPDIDLDDPEILERIFAPDANRIRKLYKKAGANDSSLAELKVADEIASATRDPQRFATELCRFINGDQRKVVVVVFDNVDKLTSADQIRVFQVAQWFRGRTRSFCILPLRDETYERFKNKPPLDAFNNSIHFTIESPRFIDVVRKRLELAIDHIAKDAPKRLYYSLPDGKQISYPATRLGEFLKTLYADIFRGGRRVSWLLEALAGRNVRDALEMFTRILMSGHLDDRQITGTLLGGEKFQIRDSTIVNVLMKTDYVYSANSHGFLTNVLFCNPNWKRPSNFLVFEALDYVVQRRKEKSLLGVQGYVPVSEVASFANRLGFGPEDTLDALRYLAERELLVADRLGKTDLDAGDFVRAHASGFVHSRLLLENIHYISGFAPTTFINDRKTSEIIGRLSTVNAGFSDIQFARKREIAFTILDYLKKEYDRHCNDMPLFGNLAQSTRFLLRMVESSLDIRFAALGSSIDRHLI